jgi:hypothetical protein
MILFFFFLVADLRKKRENYQIMITEKKNLDWDQFKWDESHLNVI